MLRRGASVGGSDAKGIFGDSTKTPEGLEKIIEGLAEALEESIYIYEVSDSYPKFDTH